MSKLAGILSMIVGLLMIIAGALAWGTISSQLAAEKITVPPDSRMFAGQDVRGPLTAYAQADTINHHALKASGGKTYAQLGVEAKKAEAAGDTATAEKLKEQRTTVMNGSFLRASLFTSIVGYGLSALSMGTGLLGLLGGAALLSLARRPGHHHDRDPEVHRERTVVRDEHVTPVTSTTTGTTTKGTTGATAAE